MLKKIIFSGYLIFFTFCLRALSSFDQMPSPGLPPSRDTLTILGVGDIMMGTTYPEPGTLPPDDGRTLFHEVASVLRSADVTMGNLEGVLLDGGGTAKSCRNPKVCYVFRSPERYSNHLADAGFDVMSIANNHAADFGDEGLRSTTRNLEKAGLLYAGQSARPYTTFVKNGVKYGFVAFAPNPGCVNINDLVGAKKIVAHLDSLSDVVIVSFHGGGEGADFEHVTRASELFYGENRGNVFQFAHAVIDAGADVVFGHGPHVVRAMELYKDRFIAYSLGNFCTFGGINVASINGFAPMVKVFTNSQGAFLQAQITPGIQYFLEPVKIDQQKQVIRKIQELTRQDFPDGKIAIDEDGWVRKSTK